MLQEAKLFPKSPSLSLRKAYIPKEDTLNWYCNGNKYSPGPQWKKNNVADGKVKCFWLFLSFVYSFL